MEQRGQGHAFGRHPHHTSSLSGHDSPSASSVGSSQTLVPPPGFFSGPPPPPPPRPRTDYYPPQSHGRSPVLYGREYPAYPYRRHSPPPSGGVIATTPDGTHHGDGYMGAAVSPTGISSASLAQKRAYRQRRKDPSCDACRERKVKCDATDTTSCSECSSRSVKCQFTKETNRRMSSIKQVQDLQNQLAEAKDQIERLEDLLRKHNISYDSRQSTEDRFPPIAEVPAVLSERRPSSPFNSGEKSSKIQRDVRKYSQGIYDVPRADTKPISTVEVSTDELRLPARSTTEKLSAQFYDTMQTTFPVLHWTTFTNTVSQIYAQGTFIGRPRVWAALFFSVLACGSCQTTDNNTPGCDPRSDGRQYAETSLRILSDLTEHMHPDHMRATLFSACYLREQNEKGQAWTCIGTAIRAARQWQMYNDSNARPRFEQEDRQRVMLGLLAFERLGALEGRPSTNNDDALLDRLNYNSFTSDPGWMEPVPRPASFGRERRSSLLSVQTVISYLRLLSDIKQASQSHKLTPANIRRFEEHLLALESHCTELNNALLTGPLHPGVMHQLSYVLSAKILLWQHALSPAVQLSDRADAIQHLARVAEATAAYLLRCMQAASPSSRMSGPTADYMQQRPGSTPWTELARLHASNHICRHIWRCALINCFAGNFQAAKTCVMVSEAIGSMRLINLACGRNLEHFVDRLSQKMQHSGGNVDLLKDEEMVALVSGDMQGDLENSWIWSERKESISTPDSEISRQDYPFATGVNRCSPEQTRKGSGESGFSASTERAYEWNNWGRVNQMIDVLQRRQSDVSRSMAVSRQSPAMSAASFGRSHTLKLEPLSQRTSPTSGSFAAYPFQTGLPRPHEHMTPNLSGPTSPLYNTHPTSPSQKRFSTGSRDSFSRPEKHGLAGTQEDEDGTSSITSGHKRTRLSNSDIPAFNSINMSQSGPLPTGKEEQEKEGHKPRDGKAPEQEKPSGQTSSGASRISIANII